ncbi:hypothetical protein BC835DRAFT_999904 [Cytidiella melzeri]|nr:hypothetical protein BC835DRAFT_999904 [Cytidiella melzeri]
MPASARPEEDSEIEEVEQPVAKKSKKASAPESSQAKAAPKKARKRRSPTPDVEFVDERSEPVPRPGKRKAAVVDIEDDEPTQKKAKKASMKDKAAPKAKKAPPKEPVHKKKKRKINIGNIFPSAQASTFDWGTLPQGDGSLNIPTQLSPVKEALLAPSRAGGSGSTGRTFGSIGRR